MFSPVHSLYGVLFFPYGIQFVSIRYGNSSISFLFLCIKFNRYSEAVHSFPYHNIKNMEETILLKLEAIERNTLLAAKTVLTSQDVAFLTGLSLSTIYSMTCKQQIPHYKPTGRHIYFDRKEIEEWMKQNRIGTIQEAERAAAKHIISHKR